MMKKIILDIQSNIHAHTMRPYSSYLFIISFYLLVQDAL